MKGLSVFALLSGLDDDMIAAAALPETRASAVTSPRRRRARGSLGEFLNNGWVAACVSVAVALAVLAAIITAGQKGRKDETGPEPFPPPVGSEAEETTQETGDGTDESGVETVADTETETETEMVTEPVDPPDGGDGLPVKATVDDDPVLYCLKPSNTQIVHWDQDPAITSDGHTVFPEAYLLFHNTRDYSQPDENGLPKEDSVRGDGAAPILNEILDELPHLTTKGQSYTLSLSKHVDDDRLSKVSLFEVRPDGTVAEIPLPKTTGSAYDELPYALPSTPGEYVVTVQIQSVYRSDDTIHETARYEYPFRLTVLPSETSEPKAPHPRITLKTETSQLVFASRTDGYRELDGKQLPLIQDRIPTWTVRFGDTITTLQGDREESLYADIYDLEGEEIDDRRPESLSMLMPGQYFVTIYTSKRDDPDSDTPTFTRHYYPLLLTVEPIDTSLLEKNPTAIPVAPTDAYLTVESGGYMVELTDGHFQYSIDWDGEHLLAWDGFGAHNAMIQNWNQLPVLTIQEGDDLTATVRSDYETSYSFTAYDMNGQCIYFTTIPELTEGAYFIITNVHTKYEYVPEYEAYTTSGYEYPFILRVQSPD